jgi:hypothetical protein
VDQVQSHEIKLLEKAIWEHAVKQLHNVKIVVGSDWKPYWTVEMGRKFYMQVKSLKVYVKLMKDELLNWDLKMLDSMKSFK